MRVGLSILISVLIFSLSLAGLATTSTVSALPSVPPEPASMPYPNQPYVSLTLTTDKAVYLAGETVNITVTTDVINTHVRITAQLPDGTQSQITSYTFNYSHTFAWTAPATTGQIRLNCEAEGLMEVVDYCSRLVCIGPDHTDCHLENRPCFRTITVVGSTYNSINVFSRTASVSGRVTDTKQNPVPGATLTIASSGQTTTSGSDGSYQFNIELGNTYGLNNGIPTVADIITVDAVACELQPGKNIQIQAGQNTSGVNFTLDRVFYPADLDLSYFTYASLPGWTAAKDFTTWQNIAAITVDGPVQLTGMRLENQPVTPMSFNVSGKSLYFITSPQPGSYALDIQGAADTPYTVSAAATVNGVYLQPASLAGTLSSNGSGHLRLLLEQGQIGLQAGSAFPVALIIVITVLVVLGGLAAAFFLTGGIKRWGSAFAFGRPAKTKIETNISKPANGKAANKSTVRQVRNSNKTK